MMTRAAHPNSAIRLGIFSTLRQAEKVVEELLAAGFTKDQISVICSDATRQRHFTQFEHQPAPGKIDPVAVTAGGVIGAALAGLAAVAAGIATGGVALVLSGGAASWAGAVVGGLVGGMMSRGVEKELADYYEQAVTSGKILVAAEDHDPATASQRLATAERIFSGNGALPLTVEEQ